MTQFGAVKVQTGHNGFGEYVEYRGKFGYIRSLATLLGVHIVNNPTISREVVLYTTKFDTKVMTLSTTPAEPVNPHDIVIMRLLTRPADGHHGTLLGWLVLDADSGQGFTLAAFATLRRSAS